MLSAEPQPRRRLGPTDPGLARSRHKSRVSPRRPCFVLMAVILGLAVAACATRDESADRDRPVVYGGVSSGMSTR